MSVNREKLKEFIDLIEEEDVVQVYDFISYLNRKREKETIEKVNLNHLSEDKEIIDQVEQSREDRINGRINDWKEGLDDLQRKIEGFESDQE